MQLEYAMSVTSNFIDKENPWFKNSNPIEVIFLNV